MSARAWAWGLGLSLLFWTTLAFVVSCALR